MNVLLTGATSGIGLDTLKSLVNNGHKVHAVGRDFTKLESFLQANENQVIPTKFDLKNTDEIESLFSKFDLKDTKFDAFIHCAGVEETIPLTLYTPTKMKELYDINVFAGVEMLRHFVKKKYCNDGASVVFLSSVMGALGQPGKIGYCSSKSAVLGVVKSAALEFSKRKIRVNAVLPGVVNTPMTQNLFDQISSEKIEEIKAMHPLGIGEVDDIVPVISFLISNDSKWITGQSIVVDGGYSIQ